MVVPIVNDNANKSNERTSDTRNEGFVDNLRSSIHSSDGSLQLSDDEADHAAVAVTRLNTWLNGGSNEIPLQLGTGSITSTTPVNPFVASNDLPSPFFVPSPPTTTRYHRTAAPPLDVPDHSIGVNKLSDRSRIPPSPPESISTSNNNFLNSSVFVNEAKKETILGESNQNGNTNTSTDIPPKPHHQRQRSVSWGEKPESTIPPKAPKLSPKLSPVPARHRRGPSEFSLFSVLTQTDSEGSSPRRVDMDELLRMNPLETEAETLILKVIEAQENNVRARANTSHSAILENIPDGSAHLFMPQIETVSSKSSATGTAKGNPIIFDFGERYDSDPSNRPHSSTVDLGPTQTPVVTAHSASSAPAPAAPIQSKQRPPRPNLTRNATVEHKLANLTETLAGYYNTVENAFASHDLYQRTKHEEMQNEPTSAGEKLAKNASLIYRGRQKTDGKKTEKVNDATVPDDHSTTTTKRSQWPKVRAVTLVTNPKVDKTAHQSSAAVPNHSHHSIPITSGSLEERKKTDIIFDNDAPQHPADAMECGTAMVHGTDDDDDDKQPPTSRMKLRPGENDTKPNSWRMKVPILHSKAARDFRTFAGQRRNDLLDYLRFMVLVVLPSMVTALILFYLAGNPNTGIVDLKQSGNGIFFNQSGKAIDPRQASVSWWLIFVCVRQTLTFSGAQLFQVIVVDFLCLSTRFSVNVLGSLFTLFIVQSKGWPFILCMWATFNFIILYGTSRFVQHWFFWQDVIGIFNEKNPSGNITSDGWYTRILAVSICLGFDVALKRLWLGLFLGRKTYTNYAEDLTKLVDKIVILCEIAALSREIEDDIVSPHSLRRSMSITQYGITKEEFDGILEESNVEDGSSISRNAKSVDYRGGLIVDPTKSDLKRVRLDQSQRAKITELLGAWEEPDSEMNAEDDVSISGILQFRNSLSYLNNPYMFSIAWGETTTRDRTIVGSQEVFGKLMKRSTNPDLLKFDVLAAVAKQPDGRLNYDKLRRIIRILRPDRDGFLSLLEFVKSVDAIYKEAKLLRASVLNSEKIDRAFEKAFNVLFYILILCVILGVVGLNPLRLIVSLTSVIVGFAFMVGSASSKMFEGWLFILVRRPYNIGDRIHISNVEEDINPDGSLGWIVKDLTLFHTTAVYGMTGERATMSNGSLAASRVVNMARSPKAQVHIYLKFSTDVPYKRVQIFEKALREFIKSRPREWANFAGFRATKVWADFGYIEYVVALVHREAWQSLISILESKAEVSSFCLELSKKLDMRYRSPPLPVDLAFVQRNNFPTTASVIPDPNHPAGVAATDTNSELGARIAAAVASSNNHVNDDVSTGRYKEVAAMFDPN